MPDHAAFVENARFTHEQVMVVTAHIVGWNEKLPKHNDDIVNEYLARDAANIAWTRSSFAKALVMAIHADLWDDESDFAKWPKNSIHEPWIEAFLDAADNLARPVLLIHGDSHTFRIDHPFIDDSDDDTPPITRLEVYGDEQIRAVKVTVDPSDPAVFGFMPVIVPENVN